MALASSRTISLTTIRRSRYDMDRYDMTLLLKVIEEGRTEAREVILPTRRVVPRSRVRTATE
jgi:DNA-binding LacI/PurR family transcriptional regulator